MLSERLEAIADARAELQCAAGRTFALGEQTFKAWPVDGLGVDDGRLLGIPSTGEVFSAIRANVPAFERSDELTMKADGILVIADRRVRVSDVREPDSRGLFRFQIAPAT
jgi:hypothetical protein